MVDHCRAVKEYTRSSADQDMALPHELRPPHVLDMTMNYLVNNVLDAGDDGRWEDWYEFLWNRTRGIRKVDIIEWIRLGSLSAILVIDNDLIIAS